MSSNSNDVTIHPSAIISPKAQLGVNVKVGPFAMIGEDVIIGDNSEIMHHSCIDRGITMGRDCKIFPYCSIGTDPQDITFKGEQTFVEMGDGNIVREYSTVNRGTAKGGSITRIGNNNYFMMYSHIAHDCIVGNNTTFVNGATLAGHVEVEDFAVIGAFTSVHQFVRIGRNAYIGGYTVVLQDILPFAKIAQTRERYNLYGPNSIGMMRNGFSRTYINNVKEIFNLLFRQDLNTSQSVEKLMEEFTDSEEAEIIIQFINKTKRGLLKTFTSGRV